MAEQNVITSMLDDLSKEQPISTALCIGQNLEQYGNNQSIQWRYFSVSEFLSLPFNRRYDLGFVLLNTAEMADASSQDKSQLLVKLRDLMAKRIVVVSRLQDEQLLRAFTAASLRWKSLQAKHWKSLGKVTHGQRQSLCPWVGRTA